MRPCRAAAADQRCSHAPPNPGCGAARGPPLSTSHSPIGATQSPSKQPAHLSLVGQRLSCSDTAVVWAITTWYAAKHSADGLVDTPSPLSQWPTVACLPPGVQPCRDQPAATCSPALTLTPSNVAGLHRSPTIVPPNSSATDGVTCAAICTRVQPQNCMPSTQPGCPHPTIPSPPPASACPHNAHSTRQPDQPLATQPDHNTEQKSAAAMCQPPAGAALARDACSQSLNIQESSADTRTDACCRHHQRTIVLPAWRTHRRVGTPTAQLNMHASIPSSSHP